MTDTVETLRGRLTLTQRELTQLRVILAAEVELGKRRLTEIEQLKADLRREGMFREAVLRDLQSAERQNAELKRRIAAHTDQ